MSQQTCWWCRIVAVAAVVARISAGTPAAAQSDGSLEDAYARGCPQHQGTATSNMLRPEMESSAQVLKMPAAASPAAVKSAIPMTTEHFAMLGADALFDKCGASEMDIYALAQKRDVHAMPLYAISPESSGRIKFGRVSGRI